MIEAEARALHLHESAVSFPVTWRCGRTRGDFPSAAANVPRPLAGAVGGRPLFTPATPRIKEHNHPFIKPPEPRFAKAFGKIRGHEINDQGIRGTKSRRIDLKFETPATVTLPIKSRPAPTGDVLV